MATAKYDLSSPISDGVSLIRFIETEMSSLGLDTENKSYKKFRLQRRAHTGFLTLRHHLNGSFPLILELSVGDSGNFKYAIVKSSRKYEEVSEKVRKEAGRRNVKINPDNGNCEFIFDNIHTYRDLAEAVSRISQIEEILQPKKIQPKIQTPSQEAEDYEQGINLDDYICARIQTVLENVAADATKRFGQKVDLTQVEEISREYFKAAAQANKEAEKEERKQKGKK